MSPLDTTYNLGRVHRALGVKGPINPQYREDSFSPVAIIADFSRSFAPEQVEARSFCGHTQASAGANTEINFKLHCLGSGGAIVEYVGISTTNNVTIFVQRLAADPWAFGTGIGNILQMGGNDTKSTITWNVNQPPPVAPTTMPTPWAVADARFYIPPGSYLHFGSRSPGAVAHSCTIALIWRELEEQLGAA